LVREIDERVMARGEVLKALDLSELQKAVTELVDLGVEALAICFMHSYRNPDHERAAIDYIREHFPQVYACGSADIWPQQREYERALITVINAFIGRRMSEYFSHLDHHVKQLGIPASILTTKSNGGIMTTESARQSPVETLLSGPASGVIGALYIGHQSGHTRLVALDMGGTSADIAVIDGDVLYSTESTIAHLPIMMPAVDVSSIGAGGGSIAWVDAQGILKVGPRSAGADPGPACYGSGGTEPTVTDAYVQLGMIDPSTFLGGRLPLDASLAEKALARVGGELGLTADEVAVGILDVTTANMHAQLMPQMARRGIDPRDFALLPYGGAGPTHAMLLAGEIGIRTVIVPPAPGTLCALGCLVADIKRDSIRTLYADTADVDVLEIEREFTVLEADGREWLSQQHAQTDASMTLRSADMRYKGQSFDLTVPLSMRFDGASMDSIRAPFHEAYQRIYGIADLEAPVEIINLRVTVVGITPKPHWIGGGRAVGVKKEEPRTRAVNEKGKKVAALIYRREALSVGEAFPGPAIVEADDTTVFVPSGYSCAVDKFWNLICERGDHED
jgi:N-methylhydantoinase A